MNGLILRRNEVIDFSEEILLADNLALNKRVI